MEKQPSFITFERLTEQPAAARLAAAAKAVMYPKAKAAWFCIVDNGVIHASTNPMKQYFVCYPHMFAEIINRGDGPEICMEFFNCEEPTAAPPPQKRKRNPLPIDPRQEWKM